MLLQKQIPGAAIIDITKGQTVVTMAGRRAGTEFARMLLQHDVQHQAVG
jgi:hypothetical protein